MSTATTIHSSTLLWAFDPAGLEVAHLCCNEKIEEVFSDVLSQIVNQLKVFLFAANLLLDEYADAAS